MLILVYVDQGLGYHESYNENEHAAMAAKMYSILSYMHIINAIMYLWMWAEIRSVFSLFLLPDWLNLVGAILYFCSAWLYPYAYWDQGLSTDPSSLPTTIHPSTILTAESGKYFRWVRSLELLAAVIELVASFGWNLQWYLDYLHDLATHPGGWLGGRGFSLDDPDTYGNITLIVAASYYLQYNLIICWDFNKYDSCDMYMLGDRWYTLNAICYVLCSLRDNEMFWFMPIAGRLQDIPHLARLHDMMMQGGMCDDVNKLSTAKGTFGMIGTPSSSSSMNMNLHPTFTLTHSSSSSPSPLNIQIEGSSMSAMVNKALGPSAGNGNVRGRTSTSGKDALGQGGRDEV